MISLPPPVTILILCLLSWAMGIIMAHEAHEQMLMNYLRMTREERKQVYRRGRLWFW